MQMADPYGGEEASQPGQPVLVFVAVLSPQERQKAMADAVAKAKQRATDLAKAAGVEIGPLVGLTGSCTGQISADDEGMAAVPYAVSYGGAEMLRRMLGRQTGDGSEEKKDESIGANPGSLSFTCCVTAVFQLGK
jgi:uncharacterized protein YggE